MPSNSPSTCNCDNGTCDGSGGCTCVPGWTTLTSSSTGASTNGTAKLCSDCAQGFFKDASGNCRACSTNCATCSGPTGTCTQCRAGFTTSSTDSTLCVASTSGAATCPDGSFPQASGGCAACNALCKTCTGPTSGDCLVCGAGQANLNGKCTQVDTSGICIGTGLVVDNSKGKCDACPQNCSSCSIPNFSVVSTFSSLQCTACLPGFVLSGGQCVSQCPAGQFVGSDGVSCQGGFPMLLGSNSPLIRHLFNPHPACDSSCASCAGSSSFCLTCAGSGQFALAGKCTSQCPSTTFSLTSAVSSNSTSSATGSTTGGACVSCHEDCATCSGPNFDQCTSCPVDRPVKTAAGRCLKTCSRGQFWNEASGTCDQCNSGCATCAAGGSDQCLSCSSGMVLQGGKCVQSNCPNGASGVTTLGGLCLATLLGVKPVTTSPTTNSNTPSSTSTIGQRWPFILAGGLSLLLIIIIALLVWRCMARNRRQAKTKVFKERVERDGMVSRGARAASKYVSQIFLRRDPEAENASERRYKLREKLRMSQNPPRNLAMAEDVDLEAMTDTGSRKAQRIAQWRSELEFDSPPPQAPSKGTRSRLSIYSEGTSLTEDSEFGPEPPVARSRGAPSRSNRSRTAPSHADTGSVYSESSSAAASRSTRRHRGPTPKQPIRDSDFDISQMGQYAPLAPSKLTREESITSLDEERTRGMKPLFLRAQPSVETPPPSYGFAGALGGPGSPPFYSYLCEPPDVALDIIRPPVQSWTMDIRLLLATEPSSTHEDRLARSRAIRSFSSDTTHSVETTSTIPSATSQLRRDAARVLQGIFDSQSRRSTSRGASPAAGVPAPVRSATPTIAEDTPSLPPHQLAPKKLKSQRNPSKISCSVSACSAQSSASSVGSADMLSSPGISIGSSFSYTPLPDDYYLREAEYDYAAAHDYLNSIDSDSEAEEPDTPPLDYMGTGTPLFTPRLMAKVLQAKAAGRPLQVSNSVKARVKKLKDKKSKKKDGKNKDGKGKHHKAKNGSSFHSKHRAESVTSSTASGGHRKSQGGERASVGSKRSREDESDDEHYGSRKGPYSDASSTPTAHEPPVKRPKGPKGWKGWALVEVDSSEDEEGANNLYDEDGRRIKSQSIEPEEPEEESEAVESEAERVQSKPGWKGWALVKDPPDRSKLIKLDAPPMVLTTRATRSGRTFGDKNFPTADGSASVSGADGNRRESTASSLSRKSSRASVGGR
ncbi:hypothetical protein FRB90_000053 [Tulasnella sp. 427]|nr:hypothetical protein FRB90_000053 [Tulasnella sp. 427]